jgi:hypothetical protein
MNRRDPGNWGRYAEHRQRLMASVCTPSSRGDICIFGAGNCADVDLEQLSRTFKEIHLVDLDGEAIERVREKQPSRLRDMIVLHEDIDLSGFLDRLDEWGERFPEPTELGPMAVAAAHTNLRRLGRVFDVTMSSCVLSQLVTPFHRAWVMSQSNWGNLVAATTAVYLATVAGATQSRGEGFIAFDVLSSNDAFGLSQLLGRDTSELQSWVEREAMTGSLAWEPDPNALVLQLSSPGLASLVASPRLTPPWLWDIGASIQLVYGLAFRHP